MKIKGKIDKIITKIQCPNPNDVKLKIAATCGIAVINISIIAPIIVVPNNNLFPVNPTLKIER